MCQTNRAEMTLEAKRAAKLEKKLKILLGGYQVLAACAKKLKAITVVILACIGLELCCDSYLQNISPFCVLGLEFGLFQGVV